MNLIESLLRWIHVVAGIIWIGHLYFFNFVNSGFAPTMDGDTKKKVVPELMPRALYWFRWGAAWTWVSGVLLLVFVYYHTGLMFEGPQGGWGLAAFVMLAVVFFGVFAYDALAKTVMKELRNAFIGGFVLATAVVYLMESWAGFGYRGYSIHLGTLFGTTMAFNVWFRIWPSQRQIIAATKNGQAPDPALVALAGLRSRHNTYMSVPLVFTMIAQHSTWAASPMYLAIVILAGWATVYHLYDRAAAVKGI